MSAVVLAFVLGTFLGLFAHAYFITRWIKARACRECVRQWTSGYFTGKPSAPEVESEGTR